MANGDNLLAVNAGEEIRAEDTEDAAWLLRQHIHLGVIPMDVNNAIGMDSTSEPDSYPGGGYGVPANVSGTVWVPSAGPMFDQSDLLSKTLETPLAWKMAKRRTNTVGDLAKRGLYHQLAVDESTDFTAAVLPAAPAANPRWDSFEFELVDSYGETESRDLEDAGTRALSTGTPNKRILTSLTSLAWVSGAEAALPDFPALTASTRGRLLSIKRIVGEGGTVLRDAFALHVYPMRLAVEDVHASDIAFNDTYWNPAGFGSLQRIDASSSGNLHFVPKRMHAGCRLLAVGVCWSVGNEPSVSLGRLTYEAGAIDAAEIANLGSGGVLDQAAGLKYAGEADWTAHASIAAGTACGYPIWGNGRTYGPLFKDQAAAPLQVSKLYVGVSGALSAWDVGDRVDFVRFVYAY